MNGNILNVNPYSFSGVVDMSEGEIKSAGIYHQQDAKPAIDDVICHYLDGNTLKNALNFIDYVRASKMKIKWAAVNVWSVRYKNKRVLDIIVRDNHWSVRLVYDHTRETHALKGYEAEYIKTLTGVLKDSMQQNLETSPAMS